MKIIFLIALTLLANAARADWVKMGEIGEGSLYMDPVTVVRDGPIHKVWELIDLDAREEEGALSRRLQVAYDCSKGRTKVLSISVHEDSMAGGRKLLSVEHEGHWKEVPPGTAYAAAFKKVCAP